MLKEHVFLYVKESKGDAQWDYAMKASRALHASRLPVPRSLQKGTTHISLYLGGTHQNYLQSGLALTWPWPHHDTCNGWTAYSQVLPVYHLQPIYDPLFSLVLAWAYDRCFRLSPEHLWWCSALKLENHLKIYLILAYVQTLRRLTPNLCFGQQYLTPACFWVPKWRNSESSQNELAYSGKS